LFFSEIFRCAAQLKIEHFILCFQLCLLYNAVFFHTGHVITNLLMVFTSTNTHGYIVPCLVWPWQLCSVMWIATCL